jgi:hypothetical protein
VGSHLCELVLSHASGAVAESPAERTVPIMSFRVIIRNDLIIVFLQALEAVTSLTCLYQLILSLSFMTIDDCIDGVSRVRFNVVD